MEARITCSENRILTTLAGDERPCKRCIKRGLAEACQDGVRKKAKYLHDAPPEALRPVLGPNYNPNAESSAEPTRPNGHRHNSSHSDNVITGTPSRGFFSQGSTSAYPVYPANGQSSVGLPDGIGFNPQVSPVSPSFQSGGGNNQPQMGNMLQGNTMDFNALFDPSNPALYNFDLEGLNFGSQYAGWEFGILNKMGLGAETPPRENSVSQTPSTEANYAALFGNGPAPSYDTGTMLGGEYAGIGQASSTGGAQGNLQHGLPHAYAIAAGPTSLASPSTEATASPQTTANVDGSPKPGAFGGLPSVTTTRRAKAKAAKGAQPILGKRQRDAASIYESVKEPYPYTAGFHNMLSVLRNRLSMDKLSRIAQALAEIRPSFIACTKDLTREDLVFMEKCFQRTLFEFDDFLHHCCAPTIVCRRSGEVAAVNKEFTALTGWTKDVLLGKEPNLSVSPKSSGAAGTSGGKDGKSRNEAHTPRLRNATVDANGGRPQPVFLAELLDDDSVVEFYRDFSQLAFEDSRGRVQRSCRLLQYRTESGGPDGNMAKNKTTPPQKGGGGVARAGILSNRVTKIDCEHGISRLERDGKVDCTYCWTIKRDVFDIPMMIIINVSNTQIFLLLRFQSCYDKSRNSC
jgi:hypothetical protein